MPMLKMLSEIKAVSKDAGTFDAIASTGLSDRDGESISPEGWILGNFEKNPVLLWGHEHWTPAIGSVTKIALESGVLAYTGAIAKESSDLAYTVGTLVDMGVLKMSSVGFEPFAWTDPDGTSYTRQRGSPYPYPLKGRIYTQQELVEISLCNVGSNMEALMRQEGAVRFAKMFSIIPPQEKSADGELTKTGRVLSKSNEEMLNEAMQSAQDCADAIGQVLAQLAQAEEPKSVENEEVARKLLDAVSETLKAVRPN